MQIESQKKKERGKEKYVRKKRDRGKEKKK